jgi:hypothetical protein
MQSKTVEPFTRFFAPHILFGFDLDLGGEHVLASVSAYVKSGSRPFPSYSKRKLVLRRMK